MSDFLTTQQAARHLGCTEQYVRRLIKNGQVPASRHGTAWLIPEETLNGHRMKADLRNESVGDHGRDKKSKSQFKALSFFSGALGLDLGLERAGLEVLLMSEIDKACRETIALNRPHAALIGDINEYSSERIRELAGLGKREQIHLVVGGPPCQAFSTAGKREGFHDDRGNVFLTYIQRILELQPHFAVIENVRGLLSAPLEHRPHERRGFGFPPLTTDEQKGGALKHVISMLRDGGYEISFNLYNAANFGHHHLFPQWKEGTLPDTDAFRGRRSWASEVADGSRGVRGIAGRGTSPRPFPREAAEVLPALEARRVLEAPSNKNAERGARGQLLCGGWENRVLPPSLMGQAKPDTGHTPGHARH